MYAAEKDDVIFCVRCLQHEKTCVMVFVCGYWRAGASQPSRTTGTIFLFI